MQNQTYSQKIDDQLLTLIEGGDSEAFGELARRYRPLAFYTAHGILKNEEDAEEQVQQALLKAFQHVGQFRRDAKFSTWLLRMVVNQCLMHLRRLRRAKLVSLECLSCEKEIVTFDPTDQRLSPEMESQGAEIARVLRREIFRIPPLLRNVFLLRDVDERPIPEIARSLGISVSAAKSRLVRARAELRERLQPQMCSYAHRGQRPDLLRQGSEG
jgi:RNA polymerase sigma-70 factor (ECF subfamily)